MYIYINNCRINLKMYRTERIIMWHYKTLIGILYSLSYNTALNISAIDIIILICPVSADNHRLANKTRSLNILRPAADFIQIISYIPAIHIIYYIFKIHITRCMQLILVITYEPERNIRMRKCQIFHKRTNISSLGSRCL